MNLGLLIQKIKRNERKNSLESRRAHTCNKSLL